MLGSRESKQVVLVNSKTRGSIEPKNDFKVVVVPLTKDLKDGESVVKVWYLALEPYMRLLNNMIMMTLT
jgi:NADPH-dependent curcumin reductase CurA